MKQIALTCSLFALTLSGCSTIPSVKYRSLTPGSSIEGMADSFVLRATALEISAKEAFTKTKQMNETTGKLETVDVREVDIAIKPVNREALSARYGIKGLSSAFSSTTVNLVKIQNTSMVKSIGVETDNTIVDSINQAGGVVTKLISLFTGVIGVSGEGKCIATSKNKYTFDLDPSKGSQKFKGESSDCVIVTYGDLPSDARELSKIPQDEKTSLYFFSACRDATVVVKHEGREIKKTFKISDPSHVQAVELPAKGKIEHHSVCGVSVVTEKADTAKPADIVGALEAQGKAIKDAIEAANKPSSD